jgi:hypothetical protein
MDFPLEKEKGSELQEKLDRRKGLRADEEFLIHDVGRGVRVYPSASG